MPIQFEDQPNDKFVIYVTELTNRVMIFFMAGNFSREECLRFIAYYPTEEISIANEHLIPITTNIFQNVISVKVKGLKMAVSGQELPSWLQYFVNEFGGRLKFTDAYTFYVNRHVLLTKVGDRS